MRPARTFFKVLGLPFAQWMWIFWPLRFFIRLKASPEGFHRDKLMHKTDAGVEPEVLYVLPRFSLIDVFVLHRLLRKLNVPRPRAEGAPNRFRKAALLAVRFRKGLINLNEPREAFSERLASILSADARVRSGSLVLQPVSIFFTRSAERSERHFILRSLFPDDENAGSFQKLVFLLIHGGLVRIHMGERIALSASARDVFLQHESAKVSSGEGAEHEGGPSSGTTGHQSGDVSVGHNVDLRWARRIRRQLLIDFARERTSAMGPALYDVDAIANWILKTPETRKVMEAETKPARAERKALHYLEEIAANYNYTTVRALEKLLDLVWTSIFKGVRVRNFEAVAEVAKQGQIIWMPCHRSHLDYMLLSYVMFKKGLVTPHVAAGVNLSFWPAGPVLRRGGAFFIRRSFTGNKLYAHVLSQYIDFLMHNSFPVEFFHEGGRSRIGKLLTPKYGILSFCVSSILKRRAANTYIIPVYFGYDKVMEDGSYAAELGGMKKQKESVWQLLRSVRFLFSNYGSVDVSFGAPIHFGDAWKDFFSRGHANPDLPEDQGVLPASLVDTPEGLSSRDPRVQTFVRALARRVNQGINATSVASGSSLLTSALCAQIENDIPRVLLWERVRMLHGLVSRLGSYLGWSVSPGTEGEGEVTSGTAQTASQSSGNITLAPMKTSDNSLDTVVDDILTTGVQWAFMQERRAEDGLLFAKNPAKELNLWWYRGTIFHVLAAPGLVATLLLEGPRRPEMGQEGIRLAWVEAKMQALRTVWDEELYWPDSTSSASVVSACLRVFQEMELVTFDASVVHVKVDDDARARLRFLSDLVRPERELYALQLATALVLMETRGRFSRDELLRKTYEAHRSAFLRGAAAHPAQLSRVFGGRTFEALFKAGLFVPRDNQLLAVAYTELVSISDFFDVDVWREFVEAN